MAGNMRLKQKLSLGQPVVGTFLNANDPAIVEVLGLAGFDFVVVDTEHGNLFYHEMESAIRAADVVGLSVIVRTGDGSRIPILKALDTGADGVLVPMINNPAQALETVHNAHYPPIGTRGLSSSNRAIRYGFASRDAYIQGSAENTLVAVQIETQDAVEHVHEIASIDGVDLLFVGPSDLSMSLQSLGDPKSRKMESAIQEILSAAKTHGKALGTFVNTEEQLDEALSRGMQFIIWGTALGFVASSAKSTIAAWNKRKER